MAKIENEELLQAIEDLKSLGGIAPRRKIYGLLAQLKVNEFNNNFLFVYGTLRQEQSNFNRIVDIFGDDSFIYINTVQVSNRKMYDFGPYPVCTGGNHRDFVVGELMYCTEEVFNAIKEMEINAGYRLSQTPLYNENLETGNIDTVIVPMYIAGKELCNTIFEDNEDRYPDVKSGDWVKYLMETEIESN